MSTTKGKWTIKVYDPDAVVMTFQHATEFSIHECHTWCSFVDEWGSSHITSLPVHATSESEP